MPSMPTTGLGVTVLGVPVGVGPDVSVGDTVGLEVSVGQLDSTVLGAAMLAGVGAGVFASLEEAATHLPQPRLVTPRIDERERLARRERWRSFVQIAAQL